MGMYSESPLTWGHPGTWEHAVGVNVHMAGIGGFYQNSRM